MKTIKLLPIILLLFSIHSFAQLNDKKDQIEALKVGFITNELSLTTEEATKFWPLYNSFEKKQFELKSDKMRVIKARMNDEALERMSEKEAAALLAQMESNEAELYQIKKKFIANLKAILPATKIIKLKKAEDDFKRKLLQQYRDKGNRK
ncbi:sensor of ECF-type sigma factor [Flavobacterium eburneipallidum]|uniref:sensor of ECF-type sigma factor n=1 Tax=Flavobacterium eburneipallidum TaxID=3003263 RepID=UPI0024821B7A|nr:sensor of ECF-type sigma factor [Flavobacterium eburneipallidum]